MNKKLFYYLLGIAIFGYAALFTVYLVKEIDFKTFARKLMIEEAKTNVQVPLPVKKLEEKKEETKTFLQWFKDQFSSTKTPLKWAYYINDPVLKNIEKSPFNLVVIDSELNGQPINPSDLKPLQDKNKKIFAYISLGSAEDYRSYWKKEWFKDPPAWMAAENKLWKGNYKVTDLMSREWTDISKLILSSVLNSGFDGIIIVGVGEQKNSDIYLQRVSEYVKRKNKDMQVFVKGYFPTTILPHLDGVLKENLVFNFNGKKQPEEDIEKNIEVLKQFQQADKPVLIMEYVSDKDWEIAKTYINKNNFYGYSGPIQLNALRIIQ